MDYDLRIVEVPEGVSIRPATLEDRQAFDALWVEMLCGNEKRGGRDILLTRRSVGFYVAEFEAVATWARPGVGRVAERDGAVVGCSLTREAEFPYDSGYGRSVFGLGTVVHEGTPQRGDVGRALVAAVARELRRRGYESIIGSIHVENERSLKFFSGIGYRPFQIGVRLDLDEVLG
jgi:ribosomal protein S18 acetylase RimI-like enzyme